MVPVGGSIVYSPQKKSIVEKINRMYPGRASGSPVTDLFITQLSMGEQTFKNLLKQRKLNFKLI
jgi:O-phospho-L-seryl-tRNASec:L-selenocysteinyl-tRNA synthase